MVKQRGILERILKGYMLSVPGQIYSPASGKGTEVLVNST